MRRCRLFVATCIDTALALLELAEHVLLPFRRAHGQRLAADGLDHAAQDFAVLALGPLRFVPEGAFVAALRSADVAAVVAVVTAVVIEPGKVDCTTVSNASGVFIKNG